MTEKNLTGIGREILIACRNELYTAFPYLDAALCAFQFVPGDDRTVSIATDGENLFYSGNYLAERYLRGNNTVNRIYLHILLHCMLRHLAKKQGRDSTLWDLACDTAVESILDSLNSPAIGNSSTQERQKFYGECRSHMKVLTAEGIYLMLLRERRPEYELARLQRAFLADDHGFWDPERNNDRSQSQRQDTKWQNISDRTSTGMQTVLSQEAEGGETILEQLQVQAQDDVDYRAFLRRFAAPREIIELDLDAFDPIYYSYGLQQYGNMPLVEPPETREEKRIEELVIAIDTSMSTSGELVRQFLRCTYSILRSQQTFTRRLNIHVMQCDDTLRSDDVIHSMEELHDYMMHVKLSGGSATDFRPVFDHIAQLQKGGAFSSLRGLIYFTDGMGTYPKHRPPYETAFVLLEEPPLTYRMPPWCTRIVLSQPALQKADNSLTDDTDLLQPEELADLPDL